MKASVWALISIATLLPAPAQAGPWEDCFNLSASKPVMLRGCEQVIQSGRYSPYQLAVAHYNRGNEHIDKGRYDDAVADYSKSIGLMPRNQSDSVSKLADIHANRGRAYGGLRQDEKMMADYNSALSFNPGNATALNNRALEFLHQEEHEKAITDATGAIRSDPSRGSAFYVRAEAYAATDRPKEALADYNKAISLRGHFDEYAGRAMVYLDLERPAEALKDANKAVAMDPTDANAVITRAFVNEKLDRKQDAIADFKKGLQLSPESERAKKGLQRLGAS